LDKIIFFDGECGLCNKAIDLIIRVDTSKKIYFSSLQSPFAIRFFKHRVITIKLDTIYFYHRQRIYDRSAAIKQILLCLKGFWYIIGLFIVLIPKPIADYIYRHIAANRFKLFGKTTCRIPTLAERNQFFEH